MAKVIIISHYTKSITNLRGDLIKEWIRQGHEVLALGPEEDEDEAVENLGARYEKYPLDRTGNSIYKDFVTLKHLRKVIREEKPSVVFTYAAKPNIYGCLAGRLEKVPYIYAMINGAGYLFSENDKGSLHKMLKFFVKKLYKVAIKKNHAVFFQNLEDQQAFHNMGLLGNQTKSIRINGSGVNTERFSPREKEETGTSFLLIARLLWDKGIGEYMEAARNILKKYPEARFKILGPFDTNPQAVKEEDIQRWTEEGMLQYLGETNDVREYIKNCSVYVLPTFYKEGVPRSILEAMSMGKPIITTNTPGCRETVESNKNGILVKPGNAKDLQEAMEYFLQNPENIHEMGMNSRSLALEKFDVHKVNQQILEAMDF